MLLWFPKGTTSHFLFVFSHPCHATDVISLHLMSLVFHTVLYAAPLTYWSQLYAHHMSHLIALLCVVSRSSQRYATSTLIYPTLHSHFYSAHHPASILHGVVTICYYWPVPTSLLVFSINEDSLPWVTLVILDLIQVILITHVVVNLGGLVSLYVGSEAWVAIFENIEQWLWVLELTMLIFMHLFRLVFATFPASIIERVSCAPCGLFSYAHSYPITLPSSHLDLLGIRESGWNCAIVIPTSPFVALTFICVFQVFIQAVVLLFWEIAHSRDF